MEIQFEYDGDDIHMHKGFVHLEWCNNKFYLLQILSLVDIKLDFNLFWLQNLQILRYCRLFHFLTPYLISIFFGFKFRQACSSQMPQPSQYLSKSSKITTNTEMAMLSIQRQSQNLQILRYFRSCHLLTSNLISVSIFFLQKAEQHQQMIDILTFHL